MSIMLFGAANIDKNDKDIILIYFAIATAILTILIGSLFISSTIGFYKGIYKPKAQAIATLLTILVIALIDLFLGRLFPEFTALMKIVFILLQILVVLLVFNLYKAISIKLL